MRDFPQTADPVALDDLKESSEPPPSKTARFLLRLPHHTKRICEEAAQREGLSLNVWAARVLSEHAKASREGWRSIPVEDNARRPPEPAPAAPAPAPAAPVQPGVWPVTNPAIQPTYVPPPQWVTTTGTGTTGTFSSGSGGISSSVAPTYPDSDIPEL
jgi:hypothetical protein